MSITTPERRLSYDISIDRALLYLESCLTSARRASEQYDAYRDEPDIIREVLDELRQNKLLTSVAAAAAQHHLDALQDEAQREIGRTR